MNTIEYLRQYRISEFAIFDIVAALLGVLILAPIIKRFFRYFGIQMSLGNLMWLVIPISVLVHYLFGTNTPLTRMVLDPNGYYLVKSIILSMTLMGLRGFFFG